MTGNVASIDLSLKNIWHSWFAFRKGKKYTPELHLFQYNLESELHRLHQDLNSGNYHHGGYRKFTVNDNKRREISVAPIRDRVIHRLIYQYLTPIYDKTFIYDAWSCRLNKGLLGGIERTQAFLKACPDGYIWRSDIKKFFESIDQDVLTDILLRKIQDQNAITLIKEIISSYHSIYGSTRGMPIGNLTSQIFANIYLNELDRFVTHQLKPKSYLRYGDDFILVEPDLSKLRAFRDTVRQFLEDQLKLSLNPKHDRIIKAKAGLKFLGVIIWPKGRALNKRSLTRAHNRLNPGNLPGYSGLVKKHAGIKHTSHFNWLISEKILSPNSTTFHPAL